MMVSWTARSLKEQLCDIFLDEIVRSRDGKEWLNTHDMRRDSRKFMYRFNIGALVWRQSNFACWVQDRFDWAQRQPGIGCPYPDVVILNSASISFLDEFPIFNGIRLQVH
jgi:hypothetical protein